MAIHDYKYSQEYPITPDLLQVIGQGVRFPFEFDPILGNVVVTSEVQVYAKAHQDMHMVLATQCFVPNVCSGARFFNPNFGSRLPLLVFEPNDDLLYSELIFWTRDALLRWVPYLTFGRVSIDPSYFQSNENSVGVVVPYAIKNSDMRGVYTHPFRREYQSLLEMR